MASTDKTPLERPVAIAYLPRQSATRNYVEALEARERELTEALERLERQIAAVRDMADVEDIRLHLAVLNSEEPK